MLTNPDIHEALIELSKLDGAFVVRGDGFIQSAAVFLASPSTEIDLRAGLRRSPRGGRGDYQWHSRHRGCRLSHRRQCASVLWGKLVLHMDPEVAYGLSVADA